MANYHFYRNGGWHCKTASLQSPGPTADKAKVAAALAGTGSKAVVSTSAGAVTTGKAPARSAKTPAPVVPAAPAYANASQQQIHDWLSKQGITAFTINDDNSVDVDGDIELGGVRLYKIPVKFSSITGSVTIAECLFQTLEGLPPIIGGDLTVHGMVLHSLAGAPKEVRGSVSLDATTIKDASICPIEHVGRHFNISDCKLTKLGQMPTYVGGDFIAMNNPLTSIAGLPEKIGRNLILSHNKLLKSINGISADIGGGLFLDSCTALTSLDGLGTVGGRVRLTTCKALTSLKGLPSTINGSLLLQDVPVTSIDGFPSVVNGDVELSATAISSFHNIHKHIKVIKGQLRVNAAFKQDTGTGTKVTEIMIKKVLGILFIRGLTSIKLDGYMAYTNGKWVYDHPIQHILNKAIVGDIDVHDAQEELIDAGFAAQAQL